MVTKVESFDAVYTTGHHHPFVNVMMGFDVVMKE